MQGGIFDVTRAQQHIDAQRAARSDSERQRQQGKDGIGKRKLKEKDLSHRQPSDGGRNTRFCKKTGYVKSESRKRQSDLATTEGRPMAAILGQCTLAISSSSCLSPGEDHATACCNDDESQKCKRGKYRSAQVSGQGGSGHHRATRSAFRGKSWLHGCVRGLTEHVCRRECFPKRLRPDCEERAISGTRCTLRQPQTTQCMATKARGLTSA